MTGKDHWEPLCRARAIENQVFFCAAAQTGAFQDGAETRMTYGRSLIIDPWGVVLANGGDGVGYATARLDLDRLRRVRELIPVASHRVRLPQ
jgi:nitrilase